MKKILPLKTSLTIAWPENNFLNSMLQCKETGYDWLMNTHIQIYGSVYNNETYDIHERRITFYPFGTLRANVYDLCPFIRKYIIPRYQIKNQYKTFHEYVIEMLNNEFYINTILFEFFRKDFQFAHPCYCFGYDSSKSTIYIADNLENGKFVMKEISYNELDEAFEKYSGNDWGASVFLYELIDYTFTYNPDFMFDQIEDYLNSGNGMCYLNRFYCPSTQYQNKEESGEVYLGIKAYDLLFIELDEAVREGQIDIRSFAFLLDHKKMMCLRYEYLQKKSIIQAAEKYDKKLIQIYQESKLILNLLMRYNWQPNNDIIDKVNIKLKNILSIDIECMEHMASCIKKI